MPERTLNLPLNGREIKEAVLDYLRQQLDRDCFLHEASAYAFFVGKIHIELVLTDPIGDEFSVTRNEEMVGNNQTTTPPDAKSHTMEQIIEQKPPNQVRVETGQAVPVETKDQDGKKVIRGIRYKRPKEYTNG